MKNYPLFYNVFVLLFIFTVLPNPNNKIFAQNASAEWTIMFYMDSDNNLESPQMQDLEEMMAVGSSPDVNLVILVDRSEMGDEERGYTNRDIGGLKNWSGAKVLYIEKGKLRELATWGPVNMGDPATLKKYLQVATTQFPAKHYGLIFGDHGAGWIGIGSDEGAGGDSLDTTELPPVLKEITAQTGKFDLIGFDACMMANFEAAKAIAPYAKTMVASEELEPGNGWDYTPLLKALTTNPAMDSVTLGKTIINTFRDFYLGSKEGNRDKTVTLGVIDLAKIPALETAISNLGFDNETFMKSGGRDTWIKTSRARSRAEEFGVHNGDHFNYYDLLDYAENIKREQPDEQTAEAADAVINAVKSAVIYKINGAAHPRSNGLTIYFPPDKATLTDYGYTATPFSQTGKWLPFLADFTGAKLADTQAPKIENVASTEADIAKNDVVTVSAKVDADDIDEATFVLAESHNNEQIIIGAIPAEPDEKGILSEKWDGKWFTIGDGKKDLTCPITNFEAVDEKQDTYLAEVPAQVRYKGTNQWRDVTLYFYLDFNGEDVTGEFVYAFEFKKNQAREIDLEPGDSVRPVYLSIDNKGESELIASDEADDILNITEDDDLVVGRDQVSTGKYLIGFTVTDFAGNTSENFTQVEIK